KRWRVRDSNPRRLSRLIYSKIPLAARETRHARAEARSRRGDRIARAAGSRIASGKVLSTGSRTEAEARETHKLTATAFSQTHRIAKLTVSPRRLARHAPPRDQ